MLRRQAPVRDPLSFLAAPGDMARLIRERDWTGHPFGPLEVWPQSLRSALGICLNAAYPTAIYWGPNLRLLYNDAWAPIPGPRHPAALGAPAADVWSDIWHVIEPQFLSVIETGEPLYLQDQPLPMRRYGALEDTYWTYGFSPIRGEDGSIAGIFNSGHETTRQVLSSRQMRFLLDLSEVFRHARDIGEARHKAIAMFGRLIGADRVGFRERVASSGACEMTDLYEGPGVKPMDPAVPASVIGSRIWDRLRSGKLVAIADTELSDEIGVAREFFRSVGARAVLSIPWLSDGSLEATLFVHSAEPRPWSEFEITTAQQVLDRTCGWMERERMADRERIMMREIDHRARNTLAIVQSVVRLTLAEDVGSFRHKISDRISALARTHSLLASSRWSPVDVHELLREELAPYGDVSAGRVDIEGEHMMLPPDEAHSVALVIHELTTNAAKHGAFSAPGGRLRVSWSNTDGALDMTWQELLPDTGGTTTGSTRRGFGSSLLERVVEGQLRGSIERDLTPSGICFRIVIPLGARNALASAITPHPAVTPSTIAAQEPRKSVLIVEDEIIVAMDMEMMLEDLGYSVCGIAGSVDAALSALDAAHPSLAIVDLNLGGQSSRPVAERLAALKVPFVFASGYAELDLPEALTRDAPRVSKPVAINDLSRALGSLGDAPPRRS